MIKIYWNNFFFTFFFIFYTQIICGQTTSVTSCNPLTATVTKIYTVANPSGNSCTNGASQNISVPFSITGSFNAGNVFTLQLSNSSGSFTSPTSLTTLTQTTAGTFNTTIPNTIPYGTGYRLRVSSSNPVSGTMTPNSFDIIISPIFFTPTANVADQTGYEGQPITFTVTASDPSVTKATFNYKWKEGVYDGSQWMWGGGSGTSCYYKTTSMGTSYYIGNSTGAPNGQGGNYTSASIVSSTNASPIVVTFTATPSEWNVGTFITISGHTINTNANGTWRVSSRTATTITLQNSVGNGIGGADGIAYVDASYYRTTNVTSVTSGTASTLQITPPLASGYYVCSNTGYNGYKYYCEISMNAPVNSISYPWSFGPCEGTLNVNNSGVTLGTISKNPSGTICSGQSVTLTCTNPGGHFLQWQYDDSNPGGCNDRANYLNYNGAGGTSTSIVVSPATSKSYRVFYYKPAGAGGCGGAFQCGKILETGISVCQIPNSPSGATASSTDATSGSGTSSMTMPCGASNPPSLYLNSVSPNCQLAGCDGTVNWYINSCGGTFVGSGNPLVLGSTPTITTVYYGRASSGAPCNITTSCATVTVTITGAPAAPTSVSAWTNGSGTTPMYCSGQSPCLTATGGNYTSLNWYTGSCGGTYVGSGSTPSCFPSITSTTTYYVCASNACGSSSTTVSVVIDNAMTAPTGASSTSNCVGQSSNITLTASGGSPGTTGTLQWYTGWCGGTLIGTGNNLSISPPGSSTTYYTAYANLGCTTSCSQVTVNVISPSTTSLANGDVIWAGYNSTDYATAGNWLVYNGSAFSISGAKPTSTTNVFVRLFGSCVTNAPVVSTAMTEAGKNIEIAAGATLTTAGTGHLEAHGNFTNFGTFTTNTGTLSMLGSGGTTLSTNGSILYNLIINKTSGNVTLNSAVTVGGTLTLTTGHIISTSTNLLTLTSAASSSQGSVNSFVSGPIKKQGSTDFIFPVGKGTKWRRIQSTALTASSDFQAEYFNTGYGSYSVLTPLNNVSGIEYWTLDKTSGAASAKITLHWEDATASQINDCLDLTIAHWNSGLSKWEEYVATASGTCSGSGTGSIITNSTWATFSPFTFGSKSGGVNVLPVELLYFNIKCVDAKVTADWATASEHLSNRFILERSLNADVFSPIQTINASGNSSSTHYYSAIDFDPYQGTSYYRLVETDLNGNRQTFNPALVACDDLPDFSFSVNQSPVLDDRIGITIHGAKNENVIIVVSDVFGKELYTKVVIEDMNNYLFSIDLENKLSPGVYFISASNNENFVSKKIIVK